LEEASFKGLLGGEGGLKPEGALHWPGGYMRLADVLEYILISFKADRFKTFMSSLGIIIGVLSIVVMLSMGEGLYSGVFSEFKGLDLDVINVVPGTWSGGGGPQSFRTSQEPAKFTDKDVKALDNVVGVRSASPRSQSSAVVSFRGKNASSGIIAVSPETEDALREKVVTGRFLMESDYKAAVIGQGVSESIPHEDLAWQPHPPVPGRSLDRRKGGWSARGGERVRKFRIGSQSANIHNSPGI